MTGLRNVIGLLYRADWTRLSLSAEVRLERDGDLELGGYSSGRAALLIAPGGRYRLEHGDEPEYVRGSDGERGWAWRPGLAASPALAEADDDPPLPELLCPSSLLGGFTLDALGPVTACGRAAIAVAAAPRRDVTMPDLRHLLYDRVEIVVDAELGILLRYEETFQGELLARTELTTVTMSPPEAADPSRFTPPAGSRVSQGGFGESLRQTFSGPGWETAKNAAGLAAGGLGAWIRYAPHLPGHHEPGEDARVAAMPAAEPGPLGDGTPPPDDLLHLLYRSGEARVPGAPVLRAPVLRATVQQWHDLAAMTARVPDGARAAGHGGVGYLLDAVTRGKTVTRTTARLRVVGPDRYRVDYSSRPDRSTPVTAACDGERRWQVYQGKVLIGPAAPLQDQIANMIDSSWLLRCRLSAGREITYRGRRAHQLRVTRGAGCLPVGPLMFFPADAIVDAETGRLLRLISYAGDAPASWWELDDITTDPGDTADPAAFRPHLPPGARTVEETGNPFTDAAAVMPGLTGTAIRTTAGAVRRTHDAVSAAMSFLDDLRADRRPPP